MWLGQGLTLSSCLKRGDINKNMSERRRSCRQQGQAKHAAPGVAVQDCFGMRSGFVVGAELESKRADTSSSGDGNCGKQRSEQTEQQGVRGRRALLASAWGRRAKKTRI